jgi:hypothetical protein
VFVRFFRAIMLQTTGFASADGCIYTGSNFTKYAGPYTGKASLFAL